MAHEFKLIVISSPVDLPGEISRIIQLFENGLGHFHLRKPLWHPWQTDEFVTAIPKGYRNRIVLHAHFHIAGKQVLKGIHLNEQNKIKPDLLTTYPVVSASFHSIEDIRRNQFPYEYIFLSPVFDSISKNGHKAAFNLQSLQAELKALQNQNRISASIIALGGVEPANIEIVKQSGFSGAAVIGSVWNAADPVKAFDALQRAVLI